MIKNTGVCILGFFNMFEFKPVWFDSLGAKSSCVWIRTSDISIIIDPGIAVMQPSYPASWIKKLYWLEKGEKIIKQRCKRRILLSLPTITTTIIFQMI